jgi:hypothetical protein
MDIVTETLYSPNRMPHSRKPLLNCVTHVAIVSLLLNGTVLIGQEDAEKYEIKIISGANLVNSVKRRVATEPIVEVQDRNKKPVGGVILTFTLPQTGPGGTFTATGSNIATVTTDAAGRATMPAFESNGVSGSFNVHISGSANGQTFSNQIHVSNSPATAAHATALKVTIFVAAATGIAAGIAAGRSGSSKTTVTPGTPTIGPASAGSRR